MFFQELRLRWKSLWRPRRKIPYIWCWTGFTLEEIQASAQLSRLLPWLDVLVDGPFILEQRDTELLFRGSPNQRIIYLKGEPPQDDIPGAVAMEPLR